MKFSKMAFIIGMTVGGFNVAHAADEGNGTVTFTGSIISAPCSITPETTDQTVYLGEISDSALKAGGSSAAKPFSIDLENCDTSTLTKGVSVTFNGTSDSVNPDLFAVSGDASGAGIAIMYGDQKVKVGVATTPQKIMDGSNSLNFTAYLQGSSASGTVTPGDFTSVANFALTYN